MPGRTVLVVGGAGYIGSHTIVCLLESGYDIVVVDNLVNSCTESLDRVRRIASVADDRLKLFQTDACNMVALEDVFSTAGPFVACIHFGGLKAVGESISKPLLYYQNNLISTLNLLTLLEKYQCKALVFSSSATVYGSAEVPITESTQTGIGITNAYGRTKHMIEEILKDFVHSKTIEHSSDTQSATSSSEPWRVTILRYFNPVGAHPSGLIGEDPNGIPNNLMPFVAQVAVGRRAHLTVFGSDYDTPDGTGVRDYIHVMDLARGHVCALNQMGCHESLSSAVGSTPVVRIYNLGTGKGYSVLDMVSAMERACGRKINYVIGARRAGDIGTCYADCSAANRELGWSAQLTMDDMCRDLWNWQQQNPNGFRSSV